MEKQIIQTLLTLFKATDERNWTAVQKLMADQVLLDYSSMTGVGPSKQTPGQITDAWATLLPGYDKTHHQPSAFKTTMDGERVTVHFFGKADHFLDGAIYTVEGNYDTELVQVGLNWLITKFKFSLHKASGDQSLPQKAVLKAKAKGIRKVHFRNGGLTLIGNLHIPANFDENNNYTAIVVTGSWLTVKEQMADLYAVKLASQGYVALTFDFSTFGESEGEPRNYEVLEKKAADITAATEYLSTLSFVNERKIGGLAICASSGAMALAITKGACIKAINFVAPWLHNPEIVKPLYGGEEGVAEKIKKSDDALSAYKQTGKVVYVPAASATDKNAPMFGDFPYYLDPKRGAIKEWPNQFAVMAWRDWLEFDAIQYAPKLTVPVQIIHSEAAALPEGAKLFYEQLNGPKNINWMEKPSQFDFYDQEPYTSNAVTDVVKWFNKTFANKMEFAEV